MLRGPEPASVRNANLYPPDTARTKGARAGTARFSLPQAAAGSPIPPEATHALDRAATVARTLSARGLSVRFERDAADNVSVHVLDAGGRVLRQFASAHALDLLSGDVPGQLLAELGIR